jgi:hypothetical protein
MSEKKPRVWLPTPASEAAKRLQQQQLKLLRAPR